MRNIKCLIIITLLLSGLNILAAGDAAAGKGSYVTCSACHGANGEGNKMMNAPRLAGQDDWYILSTLKRFKSGVRGGSDPLAMTMIPMAKMLTDQQMEDIAAYLSSMK